MSEVMDPTQRAILNTIHANPDDDLPRLVFADWLEEFGTKEDQQRACSIRDMIQVKDLPLGWVWIKHKKILIDALYHRGFVHTIRCTMAQWEQHGPSICDQHPVERVVITDKEPLATSDRGFLWMFTSYGLGNDAPPVLPNKLVDPAVYQLFFDTLDEAKDWLSLRCIETARAKANQLTTCDLPG